MAHIYRGIIPFVLLQLAGLVLTIVFPQLALWLPRSVGLPQLTLAVSPSADVASGSASPMNCELDS